MTSYQRAAQERIGAKRMKDVEIQKMRQKEEEDRSQQRAAEMAQKAELLKARTEERVAKFYQDAQYVFVVQSIYKIFRFFIYEFFKNILIFIIIG